jgi:ribosome recycling factor
MAGADFFDIELLEFEEKMDAQITHFSMELAKMRSGVANPAMLNAILVEYYGVKTQLNQIASIKVETDSLIIIPFDKSTLDAITKAIFASNLGITPNNTGDKIILNIPPLTQDTRKEIVKEIDKEKEVVKTHIRTLRNAARKAIEAYDKEPGVSEDMIEATKEVLEKVIGKKNQVIEELAAKKQKEVRGN